MTIPEVAERLQVSQKTVKVWIAAGELKAINVSASAKSKKPRLRVMEQALVEFIALRTAGPGAILKRAMKKRPLKEWV